MKALTYTTLIFALVFGILANLIFPQFLVGDEVYTGNDNITYSIYLVGGIFLFFLLRRQSKILKGHPGRLGILAVQILLFSFIAGLCFGVSHVIMVSFFDPDWAQKTLALLQERWAANNYSQEAIAGQIEWTDTFHNPWKWGMVYTIYFAIIFSLIGVVTSFLLSFILGISKNSKPQFTSYN